MKPKRLIISRKGFDSGSGGCPSPIFPDGTMFSLPIPSYDEETFEDLQHGNVDIASVVNGITGGRMSGQRLIHLDPDLNFDAYRYRKERADWQQWRGILGQAGIAQSHLNNQGVGSGDVFLFFGLYRQVEKTAQGWHFVRGTPELHVLWGWLQIDQKYPVANIGPNELPWARHHPHIARDYRDDKNTVYAASTKLHPSREQEPHHLRPQNRYRNTNQQNQKRDPQHYRLCRLWTPGVLVNRLSVNATASRDNNPHHPTRFLDINAKPQVNQHVETPVIRRSDSQRRGVMQARVNIRKSGGIKSCSTTARFRYQEPNSTRPIVPLGNLRAPV